MSLFRPRRARVLGSLAIALTGGLAFSACAASSPESPGASGEKKPIVISLDSSVDLLDPQAWRTPAAMVATGSLVEQLIGPGVEHQKPACPHLRDVQPTVGLIQALVIETPGAAGERELRQQPKRRAAGLTLPIAWGGEEGNQQKNRRQEPASCHSPKLPPVHVVRET